MEWFSGYYVPSAVIVTHSVYLAAVATSLRRRRIKGTGWGTRKRIRGKNGGVGGGEGKKELLLLEFFLEFSSSFPILSPLYACYVGYFYVILL